MSYLKNEAYEIAVELQKWTAADGDMATLDKAANIIHRLISENKTLQFKAAGYETIDLTPKKSDKDYYLEFWGYELGSPEAEQAWKEKQEMTRRDAPMVMSDIQPYISQVDGSVIESRSKHKAHLKQHRMIELGNDVPKQHKTAELSRKSMDARKRQIAELTYAKLR